MGAYFIGLPPRLRNNCAEPVYNFKSDDIECITQEQARTSEPSETQEQDAPKSLPTT